MQTDKELIKEIIQKGKLKTYSQKVSFLHVYWQLPELGERTFYLFVFTTLKHDLVDVYQVMPKWMPVPYKPKIMRPIIEKLIRGLNV